MLEENKCSVCDSSEDELNFNSAVYSDYIVVRLYADGVYVGDVDGGYASGVRFCRDVKE